MKRLLQFGQDARIFPGRDGFMHDSSLENMCGFFIAGRYHNRTQFLETMIFIVVLVVGIFDRGYVLEEFSFLFWGASEAYRLARSSQ
jgi:hypothetical protein